METIDAVQLRGGPCDGQRPEPLAGTTIPDGLEAITVMDHAAGVGHVYELTGNSLIDGTRRAILDYRRTVDTIRSPA
jgi:hypothetical protein